MILHSLASIALALFLALALGLLLGRLASQWLSGRGISNLLIEVRGAVLPFVLATILIEMTGWPIWMVIALVVGLAQGISVARWIARQRGEWSPAMLGGIALGRSQAALTSAHGRARGAVVSTLATTAVHVILLEGLLAALSLPGMQSEASLGASLQGGNSSSLVLLVLIGSGAVIASESLASLLLQNGSPKKLSRGPLTLNKGKVERSI